MTNYENRIRIGSKLKLGDGDIYEITDIYYWVDDIYACWNGVVELKNSKDEIEKLLMEDILWMLRYGSLYRPESKMSEEYYERIVKPRRQNLFKIN